MLAMRARPRDKQGMNAHQRPVWARQLAADVLAPSSVSHVHDFMVLTYFTRGSARVLQGEQFEVRGGDVYLVPAGERHAIVAASGVEAWGISFCPACYAPTELASLLDPFERAAAGASKVVHVPLARREHLAALCGELQRESSQVPASLHGELVCKSLLALILAEVARAAVSDTAASVSLGLVAAALRHIERHCLGPLTLGDVASAVDRSPSHVSTLVRRATGKSVMDWIIAGRLAEARNRLLHTDEAVDGIAERVGYADATHFIRLFRRAHGVTPAAWRAQQRG